MPTGNKSYSTGIGYNAAAVRRKAYARQAHQSGDKDRPAAPDRGGKDGKRALPGLRRAARAKLKKLLPAPFGNRLGAKERPEGYQAKAKSEMVVREYSSEKNFSDDGFC
jgi:hypothetical protein